MNDDNSRNTAFCVTLTGALILTALAITAIFYGVLTLAGQFALPNLHSAAALGLNL